MRQLATLPRADDARALADYLLTLKIETQLDKQPEGWTVWVRDEDHLPRARQELEEFQRNPSDPRYKSASSAAALLRKQRQREDRAYHRRQERFYAHMGRAGAAGGVTVTLIAISVIVFLLKDGSGFGPLLQSMFSIAPYKVESVFDASAGDFPYRVEIKSEGLAPVLHGEIWRLVTPIFLHFGIWHLVFNMWCLYVLGGAVERHRGRVRYLSLVLVLAVLSNLTQYFLGNIGDGRPLASLPRSPNFGGMSGVIYGLFGYIWMKARFQPELGLYIDRTNIIILMGWFFVCMTGWLGSIANAAHVGGLLAGMLIGYVPTMWGR